jgi:hypothetical protein
MRAILAVALAALAVAACGRSEEQAASASQAPAPPPAAGPLTYKKQSTAAEVSLTLPERVGQIHPLYEKLYGEQRAALDEFAEGAVDEIEGLRAAGLPARPYTRTVEYTVTAETPRLVGLRAITFEDTGGAHPNTVLSGLIWDKAQNRVLETKDLFAKGADLEKADQALCEALKAEKRRRIGDDHFNSVFTGCPALATAQTTLGPSMTKGIAGALTALFSPYDVGPYVEGAYEIDVPDAALHSVLNPEFVHDFGGAPAPRPAGG